MCFSAPVSFTACAALTAIGVLALRQTTKGHERFFAAIPLLFAIQQGIEGILWLRLPVHGTDGLAFVLIQLYAVFIGVIWPVLIPLSLWLMEPGRWRRLGLKGMFGLGLAAAIYTLAVIVRFGVTAHIANQCLVYQNGSQMWPGLLTVYVIVTCGPFFVSSLHNVRWIGIAQMVGFVVAYNAFRLNYPSVWCFFAALISALIYVDLRYRRRHAA